MTPLAIIGTALLVAIVIVAYASLAAASAADEREGLE